MALTEFSTQTSVKTRTSDKRIFAWTDKDGDKVPDDEVFDAAFQFASAKLAEYLVPRYGETVFESWTIKTCPAQVRSLSDDISVFYLATRLNSVTDLIQAIYDDAIDTLESIKNRETLLYGVIESAEDKDVTEAPESPFDEVYYNE